MSTSPTLFLVGSEFPTSQLIKQIKNEVNFKIISFDIETHKKLLDIGLDHEISDSYLSEDPLSRVACDTLATTNKVILAGEIRGPSINNDELILKFLQKPILKPVLFHLIYCYQ